MAWFNTALDAAIVDLDGTLVDTVAISRWRSAGACRHRLRAGEPRFIVRTVGKGSGYLLRRALVEVARRPT